MSAEMKWKAVFFISLGRIIAGCVRFMQIGVVYVNANQHFCGQNYVLKRDEGRFGGEFVLGVNFARPDFCYLCNFLGVFS